MTRVLVSTVVAVGALVGLVSYDKKALPLPEGTATASMQLQDRVSGDVVRDILATPDVVAASLVRGQVYRVNPYGQPYVVAGVAVRLVHMQNQYLPSDFVNTDRDGMFYLYNVPAGDWVVEVWYTGRPEHIVKRGVRVDRPLVDVLPPIQVP